MSKSIELTQSQIKAYENGATMFLFPIAEKITFEHEENGINMVVENSHAMNLENVGLFSSMNLALEYLKEYHSPLQKGDKDVYIKEEFTECGCPDLCETCSGGDPILYRASVNPDGSYKNYYTCCEDEMNWTKASQMTKEQSRYSLKEILDGRVVRVQDITANDIKNSIGKCSFVIGDGFEQYRFNKKKFEDMYEISIDANDDYIFLVEVKR